MKKYIVSIVGGVMVAVSIVVGCMTIGDLTYAKVRAEEKALTEATREADKGIEETPETATVKIIEIKKEETTAPEIGETESPEVKYFDCALSEAVQDCIFAECERYGINPAIVVAMIERESKFDTYAMGDDGRAFGLMQIQTKWHLQRMIALDCTDLFDPCQNVTVGINYLAELKDRYGDITKALVAYNRGSYKGTITVYASEVMARASELERS